MLQAVNWPSASAVKGAFADAKALDTRVVNTGILQGEPILEAKLAAIGSKGGLSSVITEGKRAITVKVNEVVGVAGFALPGNRVDIMVNTQDEQNKPLSKIVLEQILVLAVAQEVKSDETKPKVVSAVTLEVTPEQAETLDLARSVGTLSLVLRNQIDRASVVTAGVGKSNLLDTRTIRRPSQADNANPPAMKAPSRVAPKAAAKSTPHDEGTRIEIIRGVTRSNVDLHAKPNNPS
jgi:pilus assembly protein CpaB